MRKLFTTTPAKLAMGFVVGATVAGGVATAAGTFSGNVTTACVDNRTSAIYASPTGTCAAGRSLVTLGAPAQSAAIVANNSIKAVVAKVSPAVVTVNVTTSSGGDTGSGSIIKSDATSSYILTNNHVIDAAVGGAGTVSVSLDNGDDVDATIVGRDKNFDLAVLKINRGNLPVIAKGDSSALSIGDQVIAFGSPLGLDHTVTAGIVSSLNRPVTTGTSGAESYVDAVQTDAAINPGNSGGPLTNAAGEMIGINSAIASTSSSGLSTAQAGSIGLGFAIPINEANRIVNQIIATGKSTRPLLGVCFDTSYTGKGAKMLPYAQCTLTGITGQGPAQKSGIPDSSIITQINGVKIPDQVTAIVRIRAFAPNTTITIMAGPTLTNQKSYTVTLGETASS